MNPAPRTTEEEWEEWPGMWLVRADLARELETQLTELCAKTKELRQEENASNHYLSRAEAADAEFTELKNEFCKMGLETAKMADRNVELRIRVVAAEAECKEQARLLGKSNSREAALLAKVDLLQGLWVKFIGLMDIVEESDSGNEFRPNRIFSCRALDAQKMADIIEEAKRVVNADVNKVH
jgi:hypothetical protein